MAKKCFLCGEQWKSNRSSKINITFHALPTSNETRQKWLDSLQWNEPLEPGKRYFVCSRHFAKDDLVNNNLEHFSRTRIRRGVIPTILNPLSIDFYQTNTDGETSSSADDATSIDTNTTVTATSVSESDYPFNSTNTATKLPLNETKANASVNNFKITDSKSISKKFDFGKRMSIGERLKYRNKSRRRNFFEMYNRTILNLRKKNKLLQAQVRRLKKPAFRETTFVKPEYLTPIEENIALDYLESSDPSPSDHKNSEFYHRDHDYAIDPVETIRIVVCPD